MRPHGGRHTRPLAIVLLAVVASVLWAPVHAQAATEGLDVVGTTTYRLDTEADVVRVTTEVALTNEIPSRRSGLYIEQFYFPEFTLPAAGPVTNVVATSGTGRSLSTSIESIESELVAIVVDLSPNLVHGAPQTVTVTYDLPAQTARSDSPTRVNDAYASWLAVSTGDDGQASMTIDVPERFARNFERAAEAATRVEDGRRIYDFDVEREAEGLILVSVLDQDRLLEEQLEVDGLAVTLQGWPGDDEWLGLAQRAVSEGLPALRDLLGLEVDGDDLTFTQASGGLDLGYAGFYDSSTDRIEVTEELDLHTMLHELAHTWLDRNLFLDRWVYEGLAEVAAHHASEELGEEPVEVPALDLEAPGAVPLNRWGYLPPSDPDRLAQEAYGYATSFAVMSALVDEVGTEGLQAMLAAADDALIPYQGDPAPEAIAIERDWRYVLDLAEQVAGATDFVDVVADHVLTEDQRSLLAERATSQENFAEFAAQSDGWTPPLHLRGRMARWAFEQVDGLIEEAAQQRDRAMALTDRLAQAEVAAGWIEDTYESAHDLGALAEELDEVTGVVDSLVDTDERLATASPVARLGLVGRAGLAEARDAMADEDLDLAQAEIAEAAATIDAATTRGGLALGAVVLILLAAAAQVRGRRRRTR